MPDKRSDEFSIPDWKLSLTDPVRDELVIHGQKPDLDAIRRLFPATTGDAAFDPQAINDGIAKLKTIPAIDTGYPFLDQSVKTGLASIDITFQGDHPKYGTTGYSESCHDGFPPTIIAAVDALSGWGLSRRAAELFQYWLVNFVNDDGTIRYRGTSLAELGQLLDTATLLEERCGPDGWWDEAETRLDSIVERLLILRQQAEEDDGLLVGVPEDDEKKKIGKYFHNNAWVAKGLQRWADLCERQNVNPTPTLSIVRSTANALQDDTLTAINACWPTEPDWWLPPQVEDMVRPDNLTSTREASYTNYRYWPELLSSAILPVPMAERLVNARLTAGGQFCGMTRFEDWLDDWPLADYLYGLWRLGRKDDFLLSLFGHISYHQAAGHLTAYEQVTFPPGKEKAGHCLPSQLVAARAARLLMDEIG